MATTEGMISAAEDKRDEEALDGDRKLPAAKGGSPRPRQNCTGMKRKQPQAGGKKHFMAATVGLSDAEVMKKLAEMEAEKWCSSYKALKHFKRENGHCYVKSDSTLGRWVATQRKANRDGNLDPDYKSKLSGIGFIWEIRGKSEEAPPKQKKEVKAIRVNKCKACGREAGSKKMYQLHCNFPGCKKLLCIKEPGMDLSEDLDSNDLNANLDQLFNPQSMAGCNLECGTKRKENGCSKCPFYCSEHMVSLSGYNDGDQSCKMCAKNNLLNDPDLACGSFPFGNTRF